MAKLLNIDEKEKWEKEYSLSLTLKELQLLHDALWVVPYNSLCEEAEYNIKEEVYNTEDLDILCNDFSSIVRCLDGYTSEFETF